MRGSRLPRDGFQSRQPTAHREHGDGIRPDKGVPGKPLSALDAFQQERRAGAADLEIGADGSLHVRHHLAKDRHRSNGAVLPGNGGDIVPRGPRRPALRPSPRVGTGLHCLSHRCLLFAVAATRKKPPSQKGRRRNGRSAVPPSLDPIQTGPHSAARRALPPRIARLPVTGELPAPPTTSCDGSGRDSRTHSAPQGLRACTIPGSLRPRLAAPTRSDQRRYALRLPADCSSRRRYCQPD
jgi:hypothetical protein